MTIQEFIKDNPLVEYTPASEEFVFWDGETITDEDLNKIYNIIRNENGDVIDYFEHDLPQTFDNMANTILQKYNNLV